jgi:4-hydroxy-3-polyprenylbenzoate decarboxylase
VKRLNYSGLKGFIGRLEEEGELLRISGFADPVLEIAEITDRITKSEGKALFFPDNGTSFPLLINAFGSDRRMALAMGRENLDEAGSEIIELFHSIKGGGSGGLLSKLASLPRLLRYARLAPRRRNGRGKCQQVIMADPDLDKLPVLKCWPHDGGRFITLPAVHTFNPDTGSTNVGMYRMQVFGKKLTGMHWHRHKTGARHYEAWKKRGERMPVAVTLGGDPVYTYAATAPLPEDIDEYLLAGFLRSRRVDLVKCLTQDIWVPADADIVIEGYVDPSEELLWEGPFGDHTGVYSLADWYPAFHVTAITHSREAVFPATIVGVPPQEDAWIGKATERLFLAPIRLTLAPEVTDLHMPPAGVAHNLVIVKIEKSYPGQGMKVINSLYGAGQMMFSKFIIVVSGETDIRDFESVMRAVEKNCSFRDGLVFTRGPLDVLDHSSDTFSYGSKMGIDATEPFPEESRGEGALPFKPRNEIEAEASKVAGRFSEIITGFNILSDGLLVLGINPSRSNAGYMNLKDHLASLRWSGSRTITILLEDGADLESGTLVLWQVTGNCDPARDIIVSDNLLLDGCFKLPGRDKFRREWPNVVISDDATIEKIDREWGSLTGTGFIESPSLRISKLSRGAGAQAGEPAGS